MKSDTARMSSKKMRSDSLECVQARNRNGVPAYQRIQSAIRKRIDSGQLQPGDAVAFEHDGGVERRRGIGTFVAAPKIHFNKLMSYTEQMASRSLTAASKILFAKIMDNEPEVAARLSLPPMSSVIKLERLRHAAGEPFALETCHLSAAEFPGLLDTPLGRDSLFGILERNYKVELGYADEEVDATAADPRIAELLGVPRRDPLLRIRQVIYSTKGKAIMYVLGFYRSDRHNLVIRRFR